MDRHEVGLHEERLECRHHVHAQLLRTFGGDVRVERDDAHAESLRARRDERADAAEPDQPDGLALELDALPALPVPPAGMGSLFACGTLRACASRSAIVCSAALIVLDCGAFTTMTPRRVAASMSTLSTPIPARATTFRRGAAPASPPSPGSRSGSRARRTGRSRRPGPRARGPRRTSTWNRSRSSSRPASDSFSVTRTRTYGAASWKTPSAEATAAPRFTGMAEPFEGHLQGGEPADDVELTEVAEVPDAEDLPLEGSLAGRHDASEVGPDPVADRVRVDPFRGADRGDRPVLLQTLAEQIEPERLHTFLHRARQEL